MPEARLFLERRNYRRRRMMDAVRGLPVLCAVLWIGVPVMWPKSPAIAGQGTQTALSGAIWYLFAIWALVIIATFILSRRIDASDDADPATDAQTQD